jgi:hypothetical protein
MASTYSTDLRLELIGSGEQSGVWGSTTNLNLGSLIEQAIAGVQTIAITSADQALTAFYGAVDQSRNAVLVLNSSSAANVYVPPVSKVYIVQNAGSFAITMYNSTVLGNTTQAGAGITVASGATTFMFTDGTSFYAASIPAGLTTGTGSAVLSISPALTGIPTATTANAGTNTTQIATTAFVQNAANALGTISSQNANAVAITGGTINATVIGGSNAAAATFTTATATTVALANNWTVTVSSGKLVFQVSGVTKGSLDSSGNFIVTGNVTAYGTP